MSLSSSLYMCGRCGIQVILAEVRWRESTIEEIVLIGAGFGMA